MTDNLKRYPTTKDSGVDWLGEVPAHWEISRLKSSVTNVLEYATVNQRDDGPVVALENVESWSGRVTQADLGSSFDSELKCFQAGDVLFGKLRPYLAKVARSSFSGLCVGEFLVLRPRCGTYVGACLEHLLRSKPLIDAVNSSTFGAKMPRAEWQFMGGMPLARPPLSEQVAIVRFLKHTDRRIRRYIRAKQKLIALLEEQKQVVVHQAVTGQIDVRTGRPYPSYKESGVNWLGPVPKHWSYRRLKSLVKRIDQGVSPQAENDLADSGSWGVLKAGCVNSGEFRDSEHKRLPSDFVIDPEITVHLGDVLVSRASGSPRLVGSVGRVSALRYRLILSDKTFRLAFEDEADPDFMVLAMKGPHYRQQVERAISGAEGLANNLPLSSLRAFCFAIPPIDEQRAVVRHIAITWGDKLASALRSAQRAAALFDEYRTRDSRRCHG